MTMAIGEADAAEDVVVTERPSMEWLELVTGDSASAEAQRLADQITSGEGMLRFATLEAEGQLAGAGVSVDLDRYTTIYNMVTAPDHQKRGVATRVVTTLLAMGRLAGSTHAVLQVTQDNSAAQGLYRKLGFEPAYDYWYLEP